ncbi:MAG: hypothetical protein JWP44_2118 [Mucilaginibacter sp.]|nr:hypothetical protein [Mucilaginibacter sp.]
MKSLPLVLLVAGLLIAMNIQAQDPFSLRKSFGSKNDKADPASFTFNKPKDADASWAADAAFGYNLLRKAPQIITLDPYIEFHKNTLIKKKQDSREVGLSLQWQTTTFRMGSPIWSPVFIVAEKYNEDRAKGNNSMRGNVYFTADFKGQHFGFFSFIVPNQIVTAGDAFDFQYTPYVGVEHENRTKAESDSASGHIYRYLLRINPQISLFPTNNSMAGRIVLGVDYQYRRDFSKSVKEMAYNGHEYFTAGIKYVFIKSTDKRKFAAVGLDFVNGEDPTTNFKQQSYYAISLKVKM